MKRTIIAVSLVVLSAGVISCSSDEGEEGIGSKKPAEQNDNDTTQQEAPDNVLSEEAVGVPSPKFFFEVIRDLGEDSNPDILIPVSSAQNFTEERTQALAFGMYSADLAYVSSYEIGSDAIEYLKVVEEMTNTLNISGIFDQKLKERLTSNSDNIDSVFAFADVAYNNSVRYLKANDKEKVMALMLAGAWIESMFLVTSVAGDYDPQVSAFDAIKQQHLVLEAILEELEPFQDTDDDVFQIYAELDAIQEMFYAAGTEGEEASYERDANGRFIIKGGRSVVLNAENYGTIVESVHNMREAILNNQI